MKRLIAVFALALLAACSTTPQTAQQTIYTVTNSYVAAGKIVQAYVTLPRCGSPMATAICSRDDIIAQLKSADTVAYNALVAAEKVARAPGAGANAQTAVDAANQAIAALTAITAQLNPK